MSHLETCGVLFSTEINLVKKNFKATQGFSEIKSLFFPHKVGSQEQCFLQTNKASMFLDNTTTDETGEGEMCSCQVIPSVVYTSNDKN